LFQITESKSTQPNPHDIGVVGNYRLILDVVNYLSGLRKQNTFLLNVLSYYLRKFIERSLRIKIEKKTVRCYVFDFTFSPRSFVAFPCDVVDKHLRSSNL